MQNQEGSMFLLMCKSVQGMGKGDPYPMMRKTVKEAHPRKD